ncbi:MAG TPA: signal peptidase I [Drouetiella sp.]|jgi:signal peptidase I
MRNLKIVLQVLLVLLCMISVMAAFLWMRCSIEGRRVTAENMAPTLKTNEKVLFDMTRYRAGKSFARGQIVLFFPPATKIRPKDISRDPMSLLDKAFAPPSLHTPESSIKRVIGLPGDKIEVKDGVVYINDEKLSEPYIQEPPRYELHKLKDLGGELLSGGSIYPYPGQEEAIVVPPGHLFVLGDNRNNSQDSHLWGFLDQERVLGKAILVFYPRLQIIQSPQ